MHHSRHWHSGYRHLALGALACLAAGAASAQTPDATPAPALTSPPPPTTTPHYNLGLPMFAAGADPYNLSSATTAPAPQVSAATSQTALSNEYTFDTFRPQIHGYVSAGVATHNGHDFSGGVEMPLVPGKVDVAVGANTGQVGGFLPVVPGGKRTTVRYDSYYASVHLHPADNVDAYIGVVGGHLSLPQAVVP